jgi:hypothetical protein
MPSPTVIAAESDILATTKAGPLPAQATCPAGTNPDAPGPADQGRPLTETAGAMAFDRHAGRVALLAAEMSVGSNTWTFDVCANVWQRMSPSEEPPVPRDGGQVSLVYDVDSDRTLAFTDTGQVWIYDLAADRSTEAGRFAEISDPERWEVGVSGIAVLYHDRSGLVIVYDGVEIWAYDVDTNSLAKVRQVPDPTRPAGSGAPDGTVERSRNSLGYDSRNDLVVAYVRRPDTADTTAQPETWTFNPRTGAWRLEASVVTPEILVYGGWVWPEVGATGVLDEGSGLTLFNEPLGNQLNEYDAAERAWRTLPTVREDAIAGWCASEVPVYDPINERIVCRAAPPQDPGHPASGVSTFSAATGEWRWLLEPGPPGSPSP